MEAKLPARLNTTWCILKKQIPDQRDSVLTEAREFIGKERARKGRR